MCVCVGGGWGGVGGVGGSGRGEREVSIILPVVLVNWYVWGGGEGGKVREVGR